MSHCASVPNFYSFTRFVQCLRILAYFPDETYVVVALRGPTVILFI